MLAAKCCDAPIPPSKQQLAKDLGVSRASLYYHPKQPAKDWHLKNLLESVLAKHPAYGHKRLALELQVNKKRVLRVMHLFGVKPYRRRGRKWRKSKDSGHVYPNLLQQIHFPKRGRRWVLTQTKGSDYKIAFNTISGAEEEARHSACKRELLGKRVYQEFLI